MGTNLDRLAQRWDRRRSGAVSSARQEAAARLAATPVVTVAVREELDVACPAEQAWALIADPARMARLQDPPVIGRIAVPGAPEASLGSRHCSFLELPDGTPVGTVWEVVELVPGSRIVRACRSTPFPLAQALDVVPLTEHSCRLGWEVRGEVVPHQARASEEQARRANRRALAQLGAHLEGRAARPAAEPGVPSRARDTSDVVVTSAHASVDIALPPGKVWEFVLDARNDRLDSADPDAMSFSVAGTPAGEVGELRCGLVHPGTVPVAVVLVELVAVDPGRAFVTRTRVVAHAAHITMLVEASPAGTRLSKQIDVQVRAHELGPLRKVFAAGAEQHLARVRRELESGL